MMKQGAEKLRQEELRRHYEEDDFEDVDEIGNDTTVASSATSTSTSSSSTDPEAESDVHTDTTPTNTMPTATGLDGDGDREVSVTAPGSSKAKRWRVAVPAAAAWNDDPKQEPHLLEFTGTPGVNPLCGLTDQSTPLDCYLKFVSPETFNDVAVETNRYASSYLAEHPPSPSFPSQKWTRTTGGLYDLLFMTKFITLCVNIRK